jgi:formylglycine-generating enzyme required for sulfatase activity
MLIAGSARAQVADVFNMPAGQTSLQFVTVGDAGNAPDTAVMSDTTTGYGSVPYVYRMGKYDVTVGQYCQFLNAVAKTDTYGLYNSGMAADLRTISITQSGSPGDYTYAVTGSYSQGVNCPVFDVSWGDAARFCNWLQNGQPAFPAGSSGEVAGSTETGVYTLNGANDIPGLMAITRNAGAAYFIPSENEWYKAAYYKGGSTDAGYWTYPTQSNAIPDHTLPDAGNSANYSYADPTNLLTPVGAYSASPGPYGTYDMGGDVFQWNEANVRESWRGLRGGDWYLNPDSLGAFYRYLDSPTKEYNIIGFRVASVPEPASIALLAYGAIVGMIWWWRRRA